MEEEEMLTSLDLEEDVEDVEDEGERLGKGGEQALPLIIEDTITESMRASSSNTNSDQGSIDNYH